MDAAAMGDGLSLREGGEGGGGDRQVINQH
jgi:hypothetical protein